MLNVLVTGSRGFLGRALKSRLQQNPEIRVLEFCRGDSDSLLFEYIKVADFIFHCAGEVRPESLDSDFQSSNRELTEKMVGFLLECDKKTPVLLTSTIHAIDPRSAYGETKLASEKALAYYANSQSVPEWIYRLPHVFGPGCKPNYNSVITTWIYNSVHELDINVFNRDIEMNYSFSLDLVDSFLLHLQDTSSSGCIYITPDKMYTTTLGVVVDLLDIFRLNENAFLSKIKKDSFEGKLLLS